MLILCVTCMILNSKLVWQRVMQKNLNCVSKKHLFSLFRQCVFLSSYIDLLNHNCISHTMKYAKLHSIILPTSISRTLVHKIVCCMVKCRFNDYRYYRQHAIVDLLPVQMFQTCN